MNRLPWPCLLVLCLFLLNAVSARHPYRRRKDPNIRLLTTIQSYMNPSADPCQDFYQYACGNWENIHDDISKYVDTIGSLDYNINQRLKLIFHRRKLKAKYERNEIYGKVRRYLETCEEQPQFDARYYLHVIQPLDGENWPQEWELWRPGDRWNVWTTLGRLQAIGFNGFPMTLELKHRNATHFQLELDKLEILGFTAYEQSLVDSMEGSLDVNYRRLAEDIQGFLKDLALLHKNHEHSGPQEMRLDELNQQVERVDFLAYFSAFLGWDADWDLAAEPIIVTNLHYFHELGALMERTSPHTLIHTIKVKLLGYLEKQMPKVDNSLFCLQHMRELVPLALDYIYEQEHYRFERNATDAVIRRVFHKMQQKFVIIIQEHSGEFSAEEIDFLQQKILKMKLNIGNLPMVADHRFYFEYFRSWEVADDDFYWNHLRALQHYYSEKYKLLQLRRYSPHHTFFTWPYGSPAFQPSANLLIIPHAYLRYPIFHPNFHELFLYAELGNTLGHEIMHAFDTNGLKYDDDGNPTSLLLASLSDNVKFLDSLQCLTQQRPTSLNEKIADFSGFRLAYDSYFQNTFGAADFHGASSLSDKQLFFIKFAQFFCAISPKRVSYDESHDTPFQRVPQVVANHPEFEEVFGCPRKTNRATVAKCNLW